MDDSFTVRDTRAMVRYRYDVYTKSETPRYCVIFDLQWQIIECRRLEPSTDIRNAMTATVERLISEGWQAESAANFGFVFLSRNGNRRLLILTERDPYETKPQSFSPFK